MTSANQCGQGGIYMKRMHVIVLMAAFSLSTTFSAYGWDLPLNIEVSTISFNYTSGGSSDGINIKLNSSNPVEDPEWNNGGQTNNKFAYLKSTSYAGPDVRVVFYSQESGIDSVAISPLPCGLLWWNMSEPKVTFNNGYSESINFETSQGTLPNEVCLIDTDWLWKVTKINGVQQSPSISIGSSSHSGYVILSDPVPSSSEPWVDVLEKACQWASGATTESSVASGIIDGIYNDFEIGRASCRERV